MKELSEIRTELQQYLQVGKWQSVLDFFDESAHEENKSLLPFKAQALLRLEKVNEAYDILQEILPANTRSEWVTNLYTETLGKLYGAEAVGEFLKEHLVKYDLEFEGLLRRCADLLRLNSKFSEAVAINQRRKAIQPPARKIGLAIQTFNKEDTLKGLFDSLLECNDAEHFAPVILQDSWKGSKREAEFKNGFQNVKQLIFEYTPRLLEKFGSIEIIENQHNMGTAPSCVKLLNHVTEKYDSFVFFEDDCILFKDTLSWTKFALSECVDELGAHFASCESVFFDYGRNAPPTNAQLIKLNKIAEKFIDKFCRLKFVPSTNFMTTSALWKRYASLRCLPRGPESLNQYYSSIGGSCIFPIVARTSDIGMEHELGFSTTALGKGNVKEIKNSYINSGMFELTRPYQENLEHQDLAYSATSKVVEEHINKLFSILYEA